MICAEIGEAQLALEKRVDNNSPDQGFKNFAISSTYVTVACGGPLDRLCWWAPAEAMSTAREEPMCFTVKIVNAINPDTLKKVAELLEIPEAERDQVIHVAVSIRIPSAPTPRRRAARAATPSATSRRRK
jgi:hypothetical protein